MGRIIFTDGIGQAVLHNAKPAPSNRFASWTPRPLPFGDKANRQSDGALTMIRLRDDFGASFDLTGIPVAAQKTNLIEVNGDITGTVSALPTGFSVVGPNTMTVQVAHNGAGIGDVGYNGLIGLHTMVGASGAIGYYVYTATNGHHLRGSAWVYIPSGAALTGVTLGWEANVGTVGSVALATADLTKRDQWQQLITTATVTAGGTVNLVLRSTGTTGAVIYSDAWAIFDTDDGLYTRMIDVADRLAYWLENGGTCQVEAGDMAANIYPNCGLAPGASAQSLTLSDKRNVEYTLSLSLVNLDASPQRMRCYYIP